MTKRYVFGLVVLVFFFFGAFSAAAVDKEVLNKLADIKERMAKAMDNEDYEEALKISLEVEELGIDPGELFAGDYEDPSEEMQKGRHGYLLIYLKQAQIYNFIHKDPENAVIGYEIVYRYQQDPWSSDFIHYAEVLRKIGKKNDAEQVLKNGLTRLDESLHPHIYMNLGWYAYLDGEYEETVHQSKRL